MITVNKSTNTLLDQEQEQMFQLKPQQYDMASIWRLLIQMRRLATAWTFGPKGKRCRGRPLERASELPPIVVTKHSARRAVIDPVGLFDVDMWIT